MKSQKKAEKNERKQTEPGRGKIIVERTFGKGDLMELYSDYVAAKIQARLREGKKRTNSCAE